MLRAGTPPGGFALMIGALMFGGNAVTAFLASAGWSALLGVAIRVPGVSYTRCHGNASFAECQHSKSSLAPSGWECRMVGWRTRRMASLQRQPTGRRRQQMRAGARNQGLVRVGRQSVHHLSVGEPTPRPRRAGNPAIRRSDDPTGGLHHRTRCPNRRFEKDDPNAKKPRLMRAGAFRMRVSMPAILLWLASLEPE